jgi:hypothetical protein
MGRMGGTASVWCAHVQHAGSEDVSEMVKVPGLLAVFPGRWAWVSCTFRCCLHTDPCRCRKRALPLGIIRFMDLRFLESRGGLEWDVMILRAFNIGIDERHEGEESFDYRVPPVFSLSAPLYASFGMGGMRA